MLAAGGVLTRDQALEEFRNGELAIREFRLHDLRVLRPVEDIALVL